MSHNVHAAAQSGFSHQSGLAYEKGRPGYSEESSELISNTFFENRSRVSPADDKSVKIVELGAGTGKFTEAYVPYFLKHYPEYSLKWTAIDPSEGFLEILDQKQIPAVQAVKGTSDAIPTESHSVDAVMIAQAFHWFDTKETLQEIHRVLKPNGLLLMIWNTYDYSQREWIRIVDRELLSPAYGDVPRQQNERWGQCFQLEETKSLFTALHSWNNPYIWTGDRDQILNRFLSTSIIVNLSPPEKMKVVNRLNEIFDTHSDFEEARKTGVYQIPYVTSVAWVYSQ